MFKKIVIVIVVIVAGLWAAQAHLKSLLPEKQHFINLKQTQASELSYLTSNVPANRGKVLAVVTSTDKMGPENKKTGYELTELARAYWVFFANGFEVDIASIKGGKPPVVIDGEDMGAFDYAFMNNSQIQHKIDNSLAIADVKVDDYLAVYFVGGKGTMFDFPNNPDIQHLVKNMYQDNKVVGAVCHGPAALVNVTLDNGQPLLAGKQVSAFTNEEELFLIPDAKQIFPFLLEDKLVEQGAHFQPGMRYLEKVVQDGKLITGQNPWSVWQLAERMVAEMGYQPKPRVRTPEEHSVELLMTYNDKGYDRALDLLKLEPSAYQRILILMHAIVAFMEFELTKGFDLIRLTQQLKELSE